MQRFVFFFVFLAVLPIGSVHAIEEEPATTLHDLARAALNNHEAIARAESQVRRADADIKLSRSILMPSFELGGNYTRYGEEQSLDLGEGESFVIQPIDDWRWSANITQTLFSGLRDWRAKDVARLQRDIAILQQNTVAANLVLTVAHGFYGTVTTEQDLEVRKKALKNIEAQLRVTTRLFDVGEATIADVARWRAEVAAAKQAVVIAEGEYELAKRRLARLTGVSEILRLDPPGPIPAPTGDIDEQVSRALENRLEMKTLRNQLEAAGLMIKIEKGAWLPEANANLGYYQQKADFPTRDWASLAINIRVPIYDGGLTAARVAQSREDLREVQLLEIDVRKGISDQVDVASITHRAAVAAFDAAIERTEAAREAHRQVDRAYVAGEASATDLLATTTEFTEAETTRIIARWQRELQAIALRHALGEPPLPDLALIPKTPEEN